VFSQAIDQKLRRSVLLGLVSDSEVSARHIGVAAKAGAITLSGYVTSHSQKNAASVAARRVKGVGVVTNAVGVAVPCSAHETAITAEILRIRSPLDLSSRRSRAAPSRMEEPADVRSHHQP